ncbi:hypothetical protein QQS21_010372 [Conoideocrella luteorostrata]|uniref:Uncharacterized protein n=1 Tax=Conoideocrella luteorostrata TaxID=1105319 RepID=A0AAJ0FWX8_9HYPO|nr:hypothetical protein QQS21_010372 [Conoideocrella luteorostrata]
MAEEPSLPVLPAVSWNERSQSFSNNPRKRVRHARSGGVYNSSDPAIFSSDDDPGLDNYVEGRKKQRYVGSWFQQRPTSSDSTFSDCLTLPKPKKERKLVRQFDSGVYLGSDGTDDLAPEVLELPMRSKLPQLSRRPVPVVSNAELLVRNKVQACLDQGNETIDLWSRGLEELSNETLSPLSSFSCVPVVAKDVAFEQKQPELKIILAMNRLRLVPGALFDLEHLTILSVRGNKLTEIPPAIAKLSNLRELNVSQNRLRSLPAELLELFQKDLRNLTLHPNPFFETATPIEFPSIDDALSEHIVGRLVARCVGRSPLQISDSAGRVLSTFKFPTYDQSNKVSVTPLPSKEADDSESIGPEPLRPSRVPSLVEVALRSCYSTTELPELPHYIPDGLSHLRELLERAVQQKDTGGISCTHCHRLIIIPALEWVEWHAINTCESARGTVYLRPLSSLDNERVVPFLRRGCSWNCGPLVARPLAPRSRE